MSDNSLQWPTEAMASQHSQQETTDEQIVKWLLPRSSPYLNGAILTLDPTAQEVTMRIKASGTSASENVMQVEYATSLTFNPTLTGSLDTVISLNPYEKITFNQLLDYCNHLLNKGGHLIAMIPGTIGLYQELAQEAEHWSEQNVLRVKRMLKPTYKLIKGRCILVRPSSSINASNEEGAAFRKKRYIDRVPIFYVDEKFAFLQPGLSIWFVAQKHFDGLT